MVSVEALSVVEDPTATHKNMKNKINELIYDYFINNLYSADIDLAVFMLRLPETLIMYV